MARPQRPPRRRIAVTLILSAAGCGAVVVLAQASVPGGQGAPIRLMYGNGSHKKKPAALIQPGWRIVDAPAAVAPWSTGLADVSALGPRQAWAVGEADDIAGQRSVPVLKVWDGNSWRTDATPPLPAGVTEAGFTQVRAITADNVWIFGWGRRGADTYAYAWHWAGTRWQTTELGRSLDGVHAAVGGPRDVQVTGFVTAASGRKPWAKRYDGTSWKKVPMPAYAHALRGRTGKDLWGVGETKAGKPAAMRWTGKAWSLVPVPAKLHGHDYTLTAVLPIGPRNVWATAAVRGKGTSSPDTAGSALLHWTGAGWTQVVGHARTGAAGLPAADGAGGVWYTTSKTATGSRLVHYTPTGKGTTSRRAPATSGTASTLTALTLIPGSRSLWAVGSLAAASGPRDGSAIDKYGW